VFRKILLPNNFQFNFILEAESESFAVFQSVARCFDFWHVLKGTLISLVRQVRF
jgi:hypothetical protein